MCIRDRSRTKRNYPILRGNTCHKPCNDDTRRVTYSFFAVRVRRACWAFFIFSSLALCCASVGFLLSATLGLSFASNTSPLTCLGFDPRASISLLASSVSATNVSPSIWASPLLISHACVSQDPLLLLPARRKIWPFSPTSW